MPLWLLKKKFPKALRFGAFVSFRLKSINLFSFALLCAIKAKKLQLDVGLPDGAQIAAWIITHDEGLEGGAGSYSDALGPCTFILTSMDAAR